MQRPIEVKETPEQAKMRLHNALIAEIQAFQAEGLPNEIIGLRVYAALVDARYQLEQYRSAAKQLAEQLGQEIENIVKTS